MIWLTVADCWTGTRRRFAVVGWNFCLAGRTDRQGGLTIGQVDPGVLVLGRPEGNYLPATGPKNPIGPVVGYPETGKNSWRAGNDDVIVATVSKYNADNGYFPGDVDYMTPQTSAEAALKWARYKSSWPGLEFSSPLARRAHYGTYEALINYSGNKQQVDGIEFRVRYANDILNRAWASCGDWQE